MVSRVVHDIDDKVDAGAFELVLNHLHHRLLGVVVRHHGLDGDALRKTRLGQQRLGLGNIVGKLRAYVSFAQIARGHDRNAGVEHIGTDEFHQLRHVDRPCQGLADAFVVERLDVGVDENRAELTRPENVHLGPGRLACPLNPALFALAMAQIEFPGSEGEIPAGVRRDELVGDLVDLGLATVILVMGFQGQFSLCLVFDKFEGAEADRLQLEAIPQFLIGLAAHDHSAVVVGHQPQQARDRRFQRDADGVGVERFNLLELLER